MIIGPAGIARMTIYNSWDKSKIKIPQPTKKNGMSDVPDAIN